MNYSEMKDYELYQLVLQGDEEAVIVYSGMAMKSGDLEEAMNILDRIDETECDIELAKKKYELLGDGYSRMGKWDQAVESYENAMELKSSHAARKLFECYAKNPDNSSMDLNALEQKFADGADEDVYLMGLLYAGKYNPGHKKVMRAKAYFNRLLSNDDTDEVIKAKCRYRLWSLDNPKQAYHEEDLQDIKNAVHRGAEAGDEDAEEIYDEICRTEEQQRKEEQAALAEYERRQKAELKAEEEKKKTRIIIIAFALIAVVGLIVGQHHAEKWSKVANIKKVTGDVIGTWYECDMNNDSVRELNVEVNKEGECLFSIGSEQGIFTYAEGQITLDYTTQEGETVLSFGEDADGDPYLNSADSNISYYRNSEIINSKKFAQILKSEIIGEWECDDHRVTINSDGTYIYFNTVQELLYREKWAVQAFSEEVWLGFRNFRKWDIGLNEFKFYDYYGGRWDTDECEEVINELKEYNILYLNDDDSYELIY